MEGESRHREMIVVEETRFSALRGGIWLLGNSSQSRSSAGAFFQSFSSSLPSNVIDQRRAGPDRLRLERLGGGNPAGRRRKKSAMRRAAWGV